MAQQILFGMSETNMTQLLLLLQVASIWFFLGTVEVVALEACVSTFLCFGLSWQAAKFARSVKALWPAAAQKQLIFISSELITIQYVWSNLPNGSQVILMLQLFPKPIPGFPPLWPSTALAKQRAASIFKPGWRPTSALSPLDSVRSEAWDSWLRVRGQERHSAGYFKDNLCL